MPLRLLPAIVMTAVSHMNYASFDFKALRNHDPELAGIGKRAEGCLGDDPKTCVTVLRELGEYIAKCVARRLEIGADLKFEDLLRSIETTNALDPSALSLFHGLRREGNRAAHEHHRTVDHPSARKLLLDARRLAVWYVQEFIDGSFDPAHSGREACWPCRDGRGRTRYTSRSVVQSSPETVLEAPDNVEILAATEDRLVASTRAEVIAVCLDQPRERFVLPTPSRARDAHLAHDRLLIVGDPNNVRAGSGDRYETGTTLRDLELQPREWTPGVGLLGVDGDCAVGVVTHDDDLRLHSFALSSLGAPSPLGLLDRAHGLREVLLRDPWIFVQYETGLRSYSLSGEERWRVRAAPTDQLVAADDDHVLLLRRAGPRGGGASHDLLCLDAESGHEVAGIANVHSFGALTPGCIVCWTQQADGQRLLRGVSPEGEALWECNLDLIDSQGSDDQRRVVGAGKTLWATGHDRVLALSLETGVPFDAYSVDARPVDLAPVAGCVLVAALTERGTSRLVRLGRPTDGQS